MHIGKIHANQEGSVRKQHGNEGRPNHDDEQDGTQSPHVETVLRVVVLWHSRFTRYEERATGMRVYREWRLGETTRELSPRLFRFTENRVELHFELCVSCYCFIAFLSHRKA